MNRRTLITVLILLTAAASGTAQNAPVSPEDGVPSAVSDTAALDAAWTAVEFKAAAEPGRTIKRRNSAAKPAAGTANKATPASAGSWVRSVGSLAAVVGVILFLAWGAKSLSRGGPLAGRAKRTGVIEIISRTSLSPRQSLCLVRVGQRMVLVGVTPDALRTLDVIHDPNSVAALAGEATAVRSAENERAFRHTLENEKVQYDAPATLPATAVAGKDMRDVRERLSDALTRVKGAARRV